MIIPKKLEEGSKVMIVSPSKSASVLDKAIVDNAVRMLNRIGLEVEFSKNSFKMDGFKSSSAEDRVNDMHEAFEDDDVDMILSSKGGFNSIHLIDRLDYNLIKRHPKIFCGYSDITAINNSIFAKTGLVTYAGPVFSKFAVPKGRDYLVNYFRKCLFGSGSFEIKPSLYFTRDYVSYLKNDGLKAANKGFARGTIVGGNASTLCLLQGTEYFPDLKGKILFLEEDNRTEFSLEVFDRFLESLLLQKGGDHLAGLVVGKFRHPVDRKRLIELLKGKDELKGIPVVFNADFGHIFPRITFPVGGTAVIEADEEVRLIIEEH